MKLYLLTLLALTPAIEAMTLGRKALSKASLGHTKTASATGSLEASSLTAQACPINTTPLSWEEKQGILMDLSRNQGRILISLIDGSVNQKAEKLLSKEQIVEILTFALSNKKMGNPNSEIEFDEKGNTPLHIALKLGKIDIAHLLLAYGAKTTIKNNAGETAYESWLRRGITAQNSEDISTITAILEKLLPSKTSSKKRIQTLVAESSHS